VEQALAAAGTADFAADTRRRFIRMYRRVTGRDPAEDPYEQLRAGVGAVFASWNSPRAKAYREHYGRDDQGGTAVVVQ
ncbi:pyruvate, phosphate dikinase, partial [Mycobacterium kansasii]